MTDQERQAVREGLDHAKQVLAGGARDTERVKRTLARSYRLDERALPVLKRAGYLR